MGTSTLDRRSVPCYAMSMENLTSGNVPHTIDSAGNIVPKPNGVSRWSSPKRYDCTHDDCPDAAVVLRTNPAHNCCANHEEGATA